LFGNAAQMGDRSHPKLNTRRRPIAKKYSDGKVIRTLKKRLKVLEIVERESSGTSICRLTVLRVDFSYCCCWEVYAPCTAVYPGGPPLAHSVRRLVDEGSMVWKRLGRRLVGSRPFRYSSRSILTDRTFTETSLWAGDTTVPTLGVRLSHYV